MLFILKKTFRSLKNNKTNSLLNLLGLTIGLTATILIAVVISDELSYDRHWSHANDNYRLLTIMKDAGSYQEKGGTVPGMLAPALKNNFPEVVEYSEIYPELSSIKISRGTDEVIKTNILHADTAVFHLLDVKLISADDLIPRGDLKKVILSESFAKTHFSGKEVLNSNIFEVSPYDDGLQLYVIAGVMKDLPVNSHLRGDMILLSDRKEQELSKQNFGRYTRHYIQLKPGTNTETFETKLNTWFQEFWGSDNMSFALQAMPDIYLKTDFSAYQPVKGSLRNVYIFGAAAVLLLLIACMNYINLSTASLSKKLKEIAVRKTLGASRWSIIAQSLSESLLLFGTALFISLLLYILAFPHLEKFIGHPIAFRIEENWKHIFNLLLTITGVCLLSGLYPALLTADTAVLSGLNNLSKDTKRHRNWLRQTLVVMQFSMTIVIFVGIIVVNQQVEFFKTKDLGFNTEGLISIDYVSWDNKENTLRSELQKNPAIKSMSFSSWIPSEGAGYMLRNFTDPNDPNKKIDLWYIAGETNLAETLGMRLKSGRHLSNSFPTDAIAANDYDAEANAIRPAVLTATAAAALHATINKSIAEVKITPVGVIEDFNSESLHSNIAPTVIVGYRNPEHGALLIRTEIGKEREVMQNIHSVWKDIYPDKLLTLNIVKETIDKQYQAEDKLNKLIFGFGLLALLIAVLGVFGLLIHALNIRTKEIAIRKVLGASLSRLSYLLAKDFIKLLLLAIALASPIAWLLLNNWLENFAYRINLQWWMFAVAVLLIATTVLLTLSINILRAARTAPVDSLRDE